MVIGQFLRMLPKEIQDILDQQGLELIEILQRPDTRRRRFYNLRVKSLSSKILGSRDLVLKIFGRGDLNVLSGFEKEAEFLDLVGERGSDSFRSYIPRFVKRGGGLHPWYLREYVKGDFLGDICLDFGIRKELLTPALKEEFLAFFAGLRVFSQGVSQTGFFSSLSPHGYEWYENDRNFYREHLRSRTTNHSNLTGGILKEKGDVLDRGANYLVHGDLYLKNMFWNGRKLSITDWELLHRGNFAFDIGFIWLFSFRNIAWRRKFLSDFRRGLSRRERAVFDGVFPVVKISLALRFIRHSEIMEEMTTGEALGNARKAKEAHFEVLQEVLDNYRVSTNH